MARKNYITQNPDEKKNISKNQSINHKKYSSSNIEF